MKKKITVIAAIILTVIIATGTVAYAENGSGIDNAIEKAQNRLEFLKQIQPLLEDIKESSDQIASLKNQLKEQRQLAKAHIQSLKSDPSKVTDEQLQTIKNIKSQMQDARAALASTSPQIVTAKQALHSARKDKNYDAVVSAYNNIINVQKTRIELLNKLIDLNKQIAAL
jgi:hypothetical protein